MTPLCPNGHSLREVSRRRVQETVEDVIYVTQLIKKFNREGSEAMESVKIPEFVERVVQLDTVEYVCDACNLTQVVREGEVESARS